MPATFVVTTGGNAGGGSLRSQIAAAALDFAATGQSEAITFAVGTVTLTSVGDTSVGDSALLVNFPLLVFGGTDGVIIQRNIIPPPAGPAPVIPFRIFTVGPRGNLTLQNLTLRNGSEQTAAGTIAQGGAIYNNQGTLTILDSTIVNNRAMSGANTFAQGGAIFSDAGVVNVQNSTFTNNLAAAGVGPAGVAQGGAIFSRNSTLTLTFSTLARNLLLGVTASDGGALYNQGLGAGRAATATVNLIDDILALSNQPIGSVTPTVHDLINDLPVADGVNSAIVRANGPNLVELRDDRGGAATIGNGVFFGGDPLLAPLLADNGGPTQTLKLMPGSPAINSGGSAVRTGATDQAGSARNAKNLLDLGALAFIPNPAPPQPRYYAVGIGPGLNDRNQVLVYLTNGDGTANFTATPAALGFDPYPGFTGGVRVAVGDVYGFGKDYIVTAPGPGGSPEVKVWEVIQGGRVALRQDFNAYDPRFTGGVNLALGDTLSSGVQNIITAPGAGGTPEVRVFDGSSNGRRVFGDFNAYDMRFTGGVTVAAGNVTGTGYADIVTGPGAGGTANVRVWDGRSQNLVQSYNAFDALFTGGISVAAGDTTGYGYANVIVGSGPGGGGAVRVFNGLTAQTMQTFQAIPGGFNGGVTVAVAPSLSTTTPPVPPLRPALVGDLVGYDYIITGAGPGGTSNVKIFDSRNLLPPLSLYSFLAFNPTFTGGIFVG